MYGCQCIPRAAAHYHYGRYHADIAPLATGTMSPSSDLGPSKEGIGDGSAGAGRQRLARMGKARYNPVNWGEFRLKRFAGDFADVGTEVQITNYLA